MSIEYGTEKYLRAHRTVPRYVSHLVEFNTEANAAEFTSFISIMEGYTVLNLLRDGNVVFFEAVCRSSYHDQSADWADWATVVRHFNGSDQPVTLDDRKVA
jgi:hypothetical protein